MHSYGLFRVMKVLGVYQENMHSCNLNMCFIEDSTDDMELGNIFNVQHRDIIIHLGRKCCYCNYFEQGKMICYCGPSNALVKFNQPT